MSISHHDKLHQLVPGEAQFAVLKAVLRKYPSACQKCAYEELTGRSEMSVHGALVALREKGFVLRYDRPEHNRYYYYPNLNKIADVLGIPENDRAAIAATRSQFVENIKTDLAGLAERKARRAEAARQREAAKQARMAARDAQARANAAEFERLTSEVATAVECDAAEPVAGAAQIVDTPETPRGQLEFSSCSAGIIETRLDEHGHLAAMRIVKKGF